MSNIAADRFYFDYVDPLSYLVEVEVREVERALGRRLRRAPLELCAPPDPMVDPEAAEWRRRWVDARRIAAVRGVRLDGPPAMVPWTRKAHELVMLAEESGLGARAHDLLFERVFVAGADIGRIDVLVEVAVELGLPATETKATLDVDRYTTAVAATRAEAEAAGVHAPPTLFVAGHALEGFHNRDQIVSFLDSS